MSESMDINSSSESTIRLFGTDITVAPQISINPVIRNSQGGWTQSEDTRLAKAVLRYRGKDWPRIAAYLPGRSNRQCLIRWSTVLDPTVKKGKWDETEDAMLKELVEKHGLKKWSLISKSIPGRMGKQCRERWVTFLNPEIKREAFSESENRSIRAGYNLFGNRWTEIARFLPGRTGKCVKNHWNCLRNRGSSVSECSQSSSDSISAIGVQQAAVADSQP